VWPYKRTGQGKDQDRRHDDIFLGLRRREKGAFFKARKDKRKKRSKDKKGGSLTWEKAVGVFK